MKLENILHQVAFTAATDAVFDRCLGVINHFPAPGANPLAQIDIFPIKEKPLIKKSHFIQSISSYKHACPRNPINFHNGSGAASRSI